MMCTDSDNAQQSCSATISTASILHAHKQAMCKSNSHTMCVFAHQAHIASTHRCMRCSLWPVNSVTMDCCGPHLQLWNPVMHWTAARYRLHRRSCNPALQACCCGRCDQQHAACRLHVSAHAWLPRATRYRASKTTAASACSSYCAPWLLIKAGV